MMRYFLFYNDRFIGDSSGKLLGTIGTGIADSVQNLTGLQTSDSDGKEKSFTNLIKLARRPNPE